LIRGDLSVRELAEFVCRQGDLYASRAGRQVDAEEGVQHQQRAQRLRRDADPHYQAEVTVATPFVCAGEQRLLRGRMDGLCSNQALVLIEEFKCCGELPEKVQLVDRGQAWLYAGMQALTDPAAAQFDVRVTYIHADTAEQAVFSETATRAKVLATLAFMLLCYTTRIERHLARSNNRARWAEALDFPLAAYRPSQQAIARRVYRAIEATENLLLEAPTGSGKTLAVLYPALKAQQRDDQLFFLTSRNGGAQAALAAATQLDPDRMHLSVVEITAKEKTCFVPGMPCDAQVCPYAAGYFDRAGTAVSELMASKLADRTNIEAVAQAHQVCPFELSLDTALWADLIIGDYNYVLDPVVRLKRFAGHDRLHLLIDEAHQLSPRVRNMLTVKIDRTAVRRAKKISHAELKKRVASIDRALMSMRRSHGQGEHQLDSVDSVTRACARLLETVAEQEVELEAYPQLKDLFFSALRWRRSEAWFQAAQFAHHIAVNGRDVVVTRACLDSGPYMQSVFAEHGAVIRFSGTVTPFALYQRLHGQSDSVSERARSPFHSDQVLVLVVRDIGTYYQQRQASLQRLVTMLQQLTAAKSGRYLIALPSYAYLDSVAGAYSSACTDNEQLLFVQRKGQSNEAAAALLEAFGDADTAVLFIVMGGIYGESVDFSAANLSGVIMVGLGLPPPSLERDLMQAYFDAQQGEGWGRMAAYTQPALVKNIQAAGRLIRSPDDFGVICLVDPRFTSREVQQFFPGHWQPQVTASADVRQKVTQFWQRHLPQEESSSR